MKSQWLNLTIVSSVLFHITIYKIYWGYQKLDSGIVLVLCTTKNQQTWKTPQLGKKWKCWELGGENDQTNALSNINIIFIFFIQKNLIKKKKKKSRYS